MTEARQAWLTPHMRMAALGGWAAAQSAGVYWTYRSFEADGYLPAPFVYDKSDTFMDFFHTLFWASNPGRYTDWLSVYPPLNFLFLKVVDALVGHQAGSDGFDLRASGGAVIWFLVACYLALPALMLMATCWSDWARPEKALVYLITISASPMLFALERGNLIVFALPLIAWLFSARGVRQSIAFAVLVNFKPYFALLGAAFLHEPKAAARCVLFSGLLFGITGLALDDHYLQLLSNLVGFSRSDTLFSLREVMSLPSSVGAFAVALRGVDEFRPFMGTPLTFGEVAALLDFARLGVVFVSVLAIVCIPVDHSVKLVVALVLIPNLGVWAGGYSLALLIPLIPVLARLRAKHIYIALVALCMLPLDVIPVLAEDIGGMNVFLSDRTIDITWTLGLGSVLRPCLALLMLGVLVSEIALTASVRRERTSHTRDLSAHVG